MASKGYRNSHDAALLCLDWPVLIVHWVVVEEPDKKTKEKGAIYVWVTSLDNPKEDRSSSGWRNFFLSFSPTNEGHPRAHVVPYSKAKHEESDGVLTKIKGGKIVIGERGETGEGEAEGEGTGDGEGGPQGPQGGGSFSRSDGITFHELPPTKLPKKTRN